jgi:fatty-acyl-CoA synthase
MVVSCIVPVDGATLHEEELVTFLRARLASFKIPRKILFFQEGDLALTGNEKVKVELVRQLAANRLHLTLH